MKQENNPMENEIIAAEENKERDRKGSAFLSEVFLWLATVVVTAVAAFLYGKEVETLTGITILSGMCGGAVLFTLEKSRIMQMLLYDNERNLWRFMLVYEMFLIAAVCCPLLPETGWPFLAVFVALMLFGNELTGVVAGCGLLTIAMLLQGNGDPVVFVIYVLSGIAGVLLFSTLDEEFRIWLPMLVSLMLQFVCLCVYTVLYARESFRLSMLLIPAVNTVVSLILLLIILKFFSFSLIYKTRDIYMDINDPECPLLVELKNVSKEEYYHTIHTSYLCSRIAGKLSLDEDVVKACGYYHRIGTLRGNNDWENTEQILKENHFPERVIELLKQYLDPTERIVAKEIVVLLFADTVISSIHYLFSNDKEAQLDYQKLIRTIFKKKLESNVLEYSEISFEELRKMKKIFVEEGLYYDFLR